MTWRIGKPNVSIRKASIICLIKLIEQKLIESEKMHANFDVTFKTLKNCIDDDWGNDIRFASVVLVKHILGYIYPHLDDENYRTIYTELLKRLDDS